MPIVIARDHAPSAQTTQDSATQAARASSACLRGTCALYDSHCMATLKCQQLTSIKVIGSQLDLRAEHKHKTVPLNSPLILSSTLQLRQLGLAVNMIYKSSISVFFCHVPFPSVMTLKLGQVPWSIAPES